VAPEFNPQHAPSPFDLLGPYAEDVADLPGVIAATFAQLEHLYELDDSRSAYWGGKALQAGALKRVLLQRCLVEWKLMQEEGTWLAAETARHAQLVRTSDVDMSLAMGEVKLNILY
jgi:hypothetical protein